MHMVSVDLHCSSSIAISWTGNKGFNGSFSTWTKAVLVVPQDSFPDLLFFNIYLNDFSMFLKETEICNRDDDTMIYA